VVEQAALLPDPIYLLIPVGSNVGSLIWGLAKRFAEPQPSWGEVLAVGYVAGGTVATVVVLILVASGVH